jgi:hypothetical protein
VPGAARPALRHQAADCATAGARLACTRQPGPPPAERQVTPPPLLNAPLRLPPAPARPEVTSAAARAREHFLGALSDILSHGLRHVVAPPSATWHHDGYLHDTASPYTHNVGAGGRPPAQRAQSAAVACAGGCPSEQPPPLFAQ